MKKIFIIHILLAMPLLAWCDNITFSDSEVKSICVKNWDTNGDGEISYEEAAAVEDLGEVFKRNTSIKSFDELQFFTGLTTMWDAEFYGCTGLVSIAIPNSVTTILNCVFQDCSALKSFSFSDGLTYIGSSAFDHCTSLTSVTIPDNVKNISYGAFSNCSALTSFTLGSGVEAVGNWIVDNCNRLTKIVVRAKTPPDASLESFTNRKNLSLYVPKGSKAAYQAADHWKEFKEIVEYDGDENINFADAEVKAICVKNWDTNGDGELSKAEAAAVNDLGRVFERNTSIKSFDELQFFTGLTVIGSSAFYCCSGLTSITIPSSVTFIGTSAFNNCSGLTSITIPSSVTSIGNGFFYECSSLTSIIIPSSVTSIGEVAFSGCSGLTSIKVDSGNKYYDSRDASNAIIETKNNTLIAGCKNTIIPNSVTSIGSYAFYGCSGLTSITIPSSVTSIGDGAFLGCSGLTSITIPSSVKSINSYAFSGCDRLTSVKVERATPVTVSSSTFSNRANATLYVPKGSKAAYQAADYWKEFKEIVEYEVDENITFADANVKALCVQNWDTNGDGELSKGEAAAVTDIGTVFKQNTSIKSFDELQYFTGLTSIGEYVFYYCSGLTSITLPNSVTSIGLAAFNGCSSITSITIPKSVTLIGENILSNCSNLTSIKVESGNTKFDSRNNCNAIIETSTNTLIQGCNTTIIPNSVIRLGKASLGGFSGLTSITIPSSVKTIDDYAFTQSGLKTVTIPETVTSLGFGAFMECKNLESVTIYTETIYSYAFYDCYSLTSVIIGNSVKAIANSVFDGCHSLSSITIPNSVTVIGNEAFGDCGSLIKVKVEIATPVAIISNVFSNRSNATLYVPKGCKAAYQAADYWKEFKEIIEFPNTDVNQDGVSNVVDVVDIARYVVGNPAETFHEFLADLNSDEQVNIADAVALVNEIAGNTNFAKAFFTPKKTITADEHLTLTENRDHSLSLSMENSSAYTAFQFDLLMNSDVDVMEMQLNNSRKNGHQLLFNKVGDGHYRVVALSTSNNCFNGNAGELLNIQLDGFNTEGLTVSDIHFYTSRGDDKQFEDLTVQGGTTAIDLQHAEEKLGTDAVYDLQGRKQSTLKRGVNIVNGKKVMVK